MARAIYTLRDNVPVYQRTDARSPVIYRLPRNLQFQDEETAGIDPAWLHVTGNFGGHAFDGYIRNDPSQFSTTPPAQGLLDDVRTRWFVIGIVVTLGTEAFIVSIGVIGRALGWW